jgi:hypothetical protein
MKGLKDKWTYRRTERLDCFEIKKVKYKEKYYHMQMLFVKSVLSLETSEPTLARRVNTKGSK